MGLRSMTKIKDDDFFDLVYESIGQSRENISFGIILKNMNDVSTEYAFQLLYAVADVRILG